LYAYWKTASKRDNEKISADAMIGIQKKQNILNGENERTKKEKWGKENVKKVMKRRSKEAGLAIEGTGWYRTTTEENLEYPQFSVECCIGEQRLYRVNVWRNCWGFFLAEEAVLVWLFSRRTSHKT
jgi:hypothetical protein